MKPYVHHCVVKEGPAAGNKARTEVTSGAFQWNNNCEFCGQPLATLEDLVLHMYDELIVESDDPDDL